MPCALKRPVDVKTRRNAAWLWKRSQPDMGDLSAKAETGVSNTTVWLRRSGSAISTSERALAQRLLEAYLLDLSLKAVYLEQVKNPQGEVVSSDWLKQAVEDVKPTAQETTRARAAKKLEYTTLRDQILPAVFDPQGKTETGKRAVKVMAAYGPTAPEAMKKLQADYSHYMDQDDLARENAFMSLIDQSLNDGIRDGWPSRPTPRRPRLSRTCSARIVKPSGGEAHRISAALSSQPAARGQCLRRWQRRFLPSRACFCHDRIQPVRRCRIRGVPAIPR